MRSLYLEVGMTGPSGWFDDCPPKKSETKEESYLIEEGGGEGGVGVWTGLRGPYGAGLVVLKVGIRVVLSFFTGRPS